ncbi:HD-GYP domain, c-di-GMP phosphodiesterase class II (or its inactivated variant) [Arsukibacterium tuosuense]|uniref:HD-GYP domain, c-di-GMP phosphodiesterase class II (Or its inactivated variant) n=1 Tax=Arsukibacterium tuosuense TaxID=1323745 RepID=A0A285IYZ5_9GAMM|nr:HD-GYP domain-containing protein [Arsukibacterium tuosuense]SNY52306.1 HD-GYP domain, c-di-GMP phosphodiesterase class II (or its inactivated variant) [Arsukibacterium tuosuense]
MAYQKVSVTELRPGSYVVEVVEQRGDIIVKHAGWVRSQQAIAQLQAKGVLTVLVDPARFLTAEEPSTAPPAEKAAPAPTETDTVPVRHLFADEWPRAEKALLQSQRVQQLVLEATRSQQPIDLMLVHEVSSGLSDSVSRNQDVLLCLTRIAEQSDSLLQHSVNCAVYIAAFAKFINLPSDRSKTLITAALLHDVGKALKPELMNQPDAAAIGTSLAALQRNKDLAGQVSLWISQHCALLDGSGSPPIKGNQIAKGSQMLAIVNQYEKLTNPANSNQSPLAASRYLLSLTPLQLDTDLLQLFIKCIGVYPPGTVVKLTTGKLALVLENNPKKPTQPKVKLFYHSVHQHHITPKVMDLSRQQEEHIEGCVDLKKYGLDVRNYL